MYKYRYTLIVSPPLSCTLTKFPRVIVSLFIYIYMYNLAFYSRQLIVIMEITRNYRGERLVWNAINIVAWKVNWNGICVFLGGKLKRLKIMSLATMRIRSFLNFSRSGEVRLRTRRDVRCPARSVHQTSPVRNLNHQMLL